MGYKSTYLENHFVQGMFVERKHINTLNMFTR